MRIEVLVKLGELSRLIKKPEDALAYFRLVMKDSPHNASALWNTAEIYIENKKDLKAKDFLEAYVQIKPKQADARFVLAQLYNRLSDYQKSILQINNWFVMISKTNIDQEKHKDGLILLADNHYNLKHYSDTINVLKPLLNEESHRNKVLYKIVIALIRNNESKRAIQITEDFIMKIPREERYGILYEIGHAYFAEGEIYKALDEWQSVYEINPSYRDISDILKQYDVLRKKPELKNIFTKDYKVLAEFTLNKFKLKSENIVIQDKEFWVYRDGSSCYVLYILPIPINMIAFQRIEDSLTKIALANASITIYTLFGVDDACKAKFFYKRTREVKDSGFTAFFAGE